LGHEGELASLRNFAPRFVQLCGELDRAGIPAGVQHDDLHRTNVFVDHGHCRVIDWGDASIGHPFTSLVVTFRFLEPRISPRNLQRLSDAYLEPWGRDHHHVFELAMRVGAVARAVAYVRQRDALTAAARRTLDDDFAIVLRRALRLVVR
jgi:aminoglycoside phosphotransferase (APT) family kinase protein